MVGAVPSVGSTGGGWPVGDSTDVTGGLAVGSASAGSHASTADIAQLRQQLVTAQATLQQVEQDGADAFFARRLAQPEEGQQVARGQALEAAAARSRVEGELRVLKDALEKAPGLSGWLMRRARRRLGRG
jgi:hypothetical protein